MSLSTKRVFVIMQVSGPTDAPTWAKVGPGRFCQKEAEKKAKALAEANPESRFYVMGTVSAHMKAPTVTSKSYS